MRKYGWSNQNKTFVYVVYWFFMLGFSASALAQNPGNQPTRNRQTADAIFTEPRDSAINQILYTLGDAVVFYIVRPKLPAAEALADAEQKVLTAMKAEVPDDVKLNMVREAEADVSRARLAALNALDRGAVPTVIRYIRTVGTTLVIVDVLGRVWVWGALNANPTWSPAVTMLQRLGNGLSTRNALPAR